MIPRSFPPAPGWSPDGHRIKATLDYGRGPEKTWVYGALRPRDGHELTMTAFCRNSIAYQRFLQIMERDNPDGEIVVVTDNLSSHRSVSTRAWLEEHPRIRQVFIPVGACWLSTAAAVCDVFERSDIGVLGFGVCAAIATNARCVWANDGPGRRCG